MQVRDKIITAVCCTVEGMEWTTVKVGQDGVEPVRWESIPLDHSAETEEESMTCLEIPAAVAEQIKGDISVPLRTADLLMRVVELPTTQMDEIADMAALQIDKIAPFPIDQIAFSHEVLRQTEENSLVLLAAARCSCIDSIGGTFEKKGIHIHSIDARIQGWMQLLQDQGLVSEEDCEIIMIDDGIDFSLVVADAGTPVAFRMLHAQTDGENMADDLVAEIQYTLTTLDAEHNLPAPSSIQFWSHEEPAEDLRARLAEKSGMEIRHNLLDTLPPLSEGIVRRALAGHNRIELIPAEWIEHKKNKLLYKRAIVATAAVLGAWLAVVLVFSTIYKVRDFQLSGVGKRAAAIAPAASKALENKKKLKKLKAYTDRSRSALECLREITNLLPVGDIEFISYNYDKSKGVSIRGTAGDDGQVDAYFVALSNSELFDRLKNQSSGATTTKGGLRTVFSATLTLPSAEEEE